MGDFKGLSSRRLCFGIAAVILLLAALVLLQAGAFGCASRVHWPEHDRAGGFYKGDTYGVVAVQTPWGVRFVPIETVAGGGR